MGFLTIRNSVTEPILPLSTADESKIELGGSRLNIHGAGDFDSNARDPSKDPDGFLVAIPQVPPYLSEHYPDVYDASKSGGPAMDEYSAEWFERLVYIDLKTANDIVADQKHPDRRELVGLVAGDLALQSGYSRGCGKTSPIVEVYEYKIGGKLEQLKGKYHALIDDFKDPGTYTTVASMRIVPIGSNLEDSLREFVNSKRHAFLKTLHVEEEGTNQAALLEKMLQAIRETAPNGRAQRSATPSP
jgi:hypothetical protein